jgi:protein-S-isoprenylcysteine O-methyltransferase Ste14
MSAFVWLGGAIFAGALGFCGYSYAVTWSHGGAFSPLAVAFDVALFSVFALHHSLFARDGVKRALSRAIPESALRSTYVWIASLLLIAVCLAWRPVGGEVYAHHGLLAIAHGAIQLAGVIITALAVRTIDPLELAGIRSSSPSADVLQIRGPYLWVRHPIYSGWLLLTFGAAHMTGDRLIFAGISTIYLLIAMPFEERSLRLSFGASYDDYKRRVRYRIVPYVY